LIGRLVPGRARTSVSVTPAGIRISGVVAAILLAGALSLAMRPGEAGPPCLIWLAFHVHCPGCGLTRSLIALLRGHLLLAARYHPLGPVIFGLLVSMATAAAVHFLRPNARPAIESAYSRILSRRRLIPIAYLVILLWITRLALEAAHSPVFIW
jgi:hypothetical protein